MASQKGHTEKGHTEKGHTEKGHTEKGHTEKGHTEKGHTEKSLTEVAGLLVQWGADVNARNQVSAPTLTSGVNLGFVTIG
jgi:hypothetical protein